MSDSLQKIIDDMWIAEDGNTIKGTADSKYEFFTVPLIRAY